MRRYSRSVGNPPRRPSGAIAGVSNECSFHSLQTKTKTSPTPSQRGPTDSMSKTRQGKPTNRCILQNESEPILGGRKNCTPPFCGRVAEGGPLAALLFLFYRIFVCPFLPCLASLESFPFRSFPSPLFFTSFVPSSLQTNTSCLLGFDRHVRV